MEAERSPTQRCGARAVRRLRMRTAARSDGEEASAQGGPVVARLAGGVKRGGPRGEGGGAGRRRKEDGGGVGHGGAAWLHDEEGQPRARRDSAWGWLESTRGAS